MIYLTKFLNGIQQKDFLVNKRYNTNFLMTIE